MIVSRTVGFKDDNQDRKGYTVYTECGKSFRLEPSSAVGYTCKGVRYDKIKDFKIAIENKDVTMDTDEEVDEAPMEEGQDIWDCVHPCAMLILSIDPKWPTPENYMTTLDAYGWLDELGRPDVAKANREITRVENLTKVLK